MMKLLYLILVMLIYYSIIYGQDETYPVQVGDYATVRFNDTHGGRNLELSYMRRDGVHRFKAGINLHINVEAKDNQGHIYKDRFWANKPWEHLGINLSYARKLLNHKSSMVSLYAFYNLEIFNIGLYGDAPLFLGRDSNGNLLFIIDTIDIQQPNFQLDHILGLSLSAKIYDNFYLSMTGGYGVLVSSTMQKTSVNIPGSPDCEMSSKRWSIGINYLLHKKTVQRLYYN